MYNISVRLCVVCVVVCAYLCVCVECTEPGREREKKRTKGTPTNEEIVSVRPLKWICILYDLSVCLLLLLLLALK